MNNNTSDMAQAATSEAAQAATSTAQDQASESELQRLQRELASVRQEAAKYRTERKKQEEQSTAAEQQRLKEQGEFQKLAEQYQARVRELEPLAEMYGRLAEETHTRIDVEIKDWPAEFTALIPDAATPVDQRLAALETARRALSFVQQQQRASLPGNAPGPRPMTTSRDQSIDTLKERFNRSGNYGF